ncbi:MAG TPA: adenylate/guanylate cyclase domain-containing protein, partial [bacterium]|nr:adenylate/guanylate cyclase domain-containing protein [bacterium]
KSTGKPQITVTVLAGPEQGQVFKIARPTTTMGRSNTCEIVITDPLVSRQHCQIILGMGGISLRDLASTNGTFLNGARVTESPLRNQDVISVGGTRLRFAVEVTKETEESKTPKIDELAHKKLLTLYEVGNIVNSVLELKTLLSIIMAMAIKVMQANRGFLLLREKGGDLKPVATHALTPAEAQAPYSQTIVDTVLRERVPVLVLDATHDVRFSNRDSLKALPLSSVICVPIWERENIAGVIYVDKAEGTSTFNEEDMYFLSAFANQAAVAIANAKLFDDVRREERLRTSLQRYLSPNIVDEMVQKTGSLPLGGEKKKVSILFCDIRGFTTLTEKEPVETIVGLLNEYFSAMSEVIFANKGTLDKFIGDAIMAIYGAPIELKDGSFQAVKTALEMRDKLVKLNEKWKSEKKPQIQVGYGINTGEAIVGNIGSELRMEYTAIGDMVNTASRVEGETEGGQILITEETFRELGNQVKV